MKLPLYVRIALWIVRKRVPEEVQDRAKLLASMREMAAKLNEQKAQIKGWRERCFSAERVVGTKLREAIRDACREHNEAHGHSIWFGY